MRPIFRPNARVRLRSPAEVGAASWVEGTSDVAVLEFFLTALARGATATAVGALVGRAVGFNSGSVASPKAASCESSGLTALAVVFGLALPFGLLAERVLAFAIGAVVGPGTSAVATSRFESTVTLGGDVFDEACWEGEVLAGCAVVALAPVSPLFSVLLAEAVLFLELLLLVDFGAGLSFDTPAEGEFFSTLVGRGTSSSKGVDGLAFATCVCG